MASTQTLEMPPQSKEAERSVLGSMLRNNVAINEVVTIVRVDDFYYDAHQKIFKTIVDIYDSGRPVDLVILAEKLRENNLIEDVGGYAFIGEIWEACPTSANITHYARIVKDNSIVRNLILTSNEILADAYNKTAPATELLESAEKRILEIAELGIEGQAVTLQEALQETYDQIDARSQRQTLNGVATGYNDLDEILSGLRNSELILIAARPSVGKTCLALNLARNVVLGRHQSTSRHEPEPVFFVSLEQARTELVERILCAQARVDSHLMRTGRLGNTNLERLMQAGDLLGPAKLYIDDTPAQSMLRISANCRRLKRKYGIKAVFIDYLQLIEPDEKRQQRHEQVAAISRRLKLLARELEIPVVALSQLNRTSEDRVGGKPRLADLRESGSLEQDADTVLLLHRPEMQDGHAPEDENVIDIVIAKQRNGRTGDVRLAYQKQFMRFDNHIGGLPPAE